jgi:hypothetical protein
MRMRLIILPSVACPAVQYFPLYPTNGSILGEKIVIEHEMCFDFLYNFCLKYFSF